MRTPLLFMITFFIASVAKAQPTVTNTSEAVSGDVIIYPEAQTSGVTIPASGTNMTWNYSGLIDSGTIEIDSFISPSSTPYSSLYPGSNLALNYNSNTYIYYQTTTTNWGLVGLITPGTDTAFYSSIISDFHFPFTYGSSYTDSSQYILDLTGLRDTSEYIVSYQGIGYGTLDLPGKTYTNVLQVEKQATDRTKYGTNTTTSMLFVSPGIHSYIMEMDFSSPSVFSGIRYVTSGTVVTPTSYTFNGNGNWNVAANWSGGAIPASPVPSGTTVTISPLAGGSCTLNVPVTFDSGSTLTVSPGAIFNVSGNLGIVK